MTLGSRPLRRHIWEALCHRLGMLTLRVLLETGMAHESASEISCPSETNNTTYAGALMVTSCGEFYLEPPLVKERERQSEAHEGLFTDGADNAFRLFVRLGLALGALFRVLFALALAFLLGLGALHTVSTRRRTETGNNPLRSPYPRQCSNQRTEER